MYDDRYVMLITLAAHKCRERVERIKKHIEKKGTPMRKYEIVDMALESLERELGIRRK